MTVLRIAPYLVVAGAALATASSGGPTGPRGDVTGSPFQGPNVCGGCHQGGPLAPETVIELLDGDGVPQTAWVAGADYTLRVAITNADSAAAYGLQAVALLGDTVQAGSFGAAPEGTRVYDLEERQYLEHTRRLDTDTVEIAWTAPAAATPGETVAVYAAGNAVDASGNPAGDNVDLAVLRLPAAASSVLATGLPADAWRAYQPAAGVLRVEVLASADAPWRVEAYDAAGRRLGEAELRDRGSVDLDLGRLTGVYTVRVSDGSGVSGVRRVVGRGY